MTKEQMDLKYSSLSLSARFAIAVRCFEDFCEVADLRHPEITKLFDFFWGYFYLNTERGLTWLPWHLSRPVLRPYNEEFIKLLQSKGISPDEFQALIRNTENTLFRVFYSQVQEDDNEESLECLQQVLVITKSRGIELPDIQIFFNDLYADCPMGKILSPEQADIWRYSR